MKSHVRLFMEKGLMVVLCAGLLWTTIQRFGNIQFAGYDGSIIANAAWQYHLGWRPYQQILTFAPPGLLIGGKLAYDFFGVSWNSLVTVTALYSVVTFFLLTLILYRLGAPFSFSVFCAFVVQAVTLMPASFWWYNQPTAVAAALFLSSAYLYFRKSESAINSFLFAGSMFLLLLFKPNVSGITLVSVGGLLFLLSQHRKRVFWITVCTGITTMCFLWIIRISPFDLLRAYTAGTARLSQEYLLENLNRTNSDIVMSKQYLCVFLSILFVITLAPIVRYRMEYFKKLFNRGVLAGFFFFLAGMLVTISSAILNIDLKMVDLPPLVISGAILLLAMRQAFSKWYFVISLVLYIVLLLYPLYYGISYTVSRSRVEAAGEYVYYQPPSSGELLITKSAYFTHFTASPNFFFTVRNIETVFSLLASYRLDGKVFFGPRVEFGYPMLRIIPPKGMPLWWGEDAVSSGIPRGQTPVFVERFKNDHIAVAVFLGQDYTRVPDEIRDFLNTHYKMFIIGVYENGGPKENLDVYVSDDEPQMQQLISGLK